VVDALPARPPASIVAVVVTYGDRLRWLVPTLEAALGQPGVCGLVLVDNGTPAPVAGRLREIAAGDARVALVRNGTNLGSAGGVRAGLEYALSSDASFVWFLDDDTRPEPGAALALLDAWDARPVVPPVVALVSRRWEPERYRREAEWNENAAFGVDLRQRTAAAVLGGRRRAPAAGDPILVRMAPWSGLFVPRGLLESAGLPDDDLVLYEDDHEFTLRLTAGGGRILVVAGSRLETLDPSWLDRSAPGLTSRWIATPDVARVYYGARNRVYVERRHLVTRPLRYALNLAAFSLRVVLSAFDRTSRHNARWFLAGVTDGWRGRLGRRHLPVQDNASSPFSG
jgi:GT2 family glycosyltransferase